MKRFFRLLGPDGKQALTLTAHNGIFWFAWAFGCYQTVYLQQVGFSASQLGVLNAISSAVAIASVSFWGMISDRIGSLRKVLIVILACAAVFYGLVPTIPTALPITVILFTAFLPVVNFFRGSMTTFAENLLVRNCNELRLNYGVLRGIGSFLFTVGSVTIASALPTVGVKNTFWMTGVLMIPVIVLTIFAREPNARPPKKKGDSKEKLDMSGLFRNPAYISFLVFAFIFYIATNCEGQFIPYFMKSVGVPSEQYGIILAYRALWEIPFLVLMIRLRRKFPLRLLVVAAPVLMSLECLGFFLFAGSLPSMLICCTFFGLGNGLFIGSSLNYVYELAPDHLKASAQAFFAAVSSVAGILGNLMGGVIFDAVGAKLFYAVVFVLYLISAGVFSLSLFSKKKNAPTPQA